MGVGRGGGRGILVVGRRGLVRGKYSSGGMCEKRRGGVVSVTLSCKRSRANSATRFTTRTGTD